MVQSDARQAAFSFHLTDFKIQPLLLNGERCERLAFGNAISLNPAGAPDLPSRVFVLGIPPRAQAEVSVVPGAFEEFADIRVLPVPTPDASGKISRQNFLPDPKVYAQDAYYPANLFLADPPAQFRQQTILRVQARPVQYNPVKKTLRVYRNLQIVVRFIGGNTLAATATNITSPAEEEFYQSALVNYAQAKSFRHAETPKLQRQSHRQIDGPLYKFPLRQEGIYKIDGRTLANAGLALADLKPSTIHLYNNGGRELPRAISQSRPQGLVENAIYIFDGGDGRFDNDDYILFYGRGVDGFAFDSTNGNVRHYHNHFVSDNYYWLSFGGGEGARMPERQPRVASGLMPVTNFTDYVFIEEDKIPLFECDQHWYSFEFAKLESNTKRYLVKLTDPLSESTAHMDFALYTPPNGARNQLTVTFEKQELGSIDPVGVLRLELYGMDKRGGLANGDNEILLTYQGSGDVARVYLDYIELRYERQLKLNDGLLIFNGRNGAAPLAYTLSNVNAAALWLFDVTDFSNVSRVISQNWIVNPAGAGQITFADLGGAGKTPRRYIAATPPAFKNIDPKTIGRDEISNWRSPANGADLVVITHEDFLSLNPVTGKDEGPLARFVSLRENANPHDALQVEVVKIQDVFDEFSGGLYDPIAIRDFLKYAYDNWSRRPLFVMLAGDGDYDPKNILNKTAKNWIPTYHTTEFNYGEIDISNRVADSWYAYLAGGDFDEAMDLAIGRIPARSLAEVETYVDKLIRYETKPALGPWRNTLAMIADDDLGDGAVPSSIESIHIYSTENLITSFTPPYFDIKKIYMTEFAGVQNASISGLRKPSATEALLRLINSGALIVNYTGHGRSDLLAHERILEIGPDLGRIQNGDRQALWIAATCTFGKFDIPNAQSFAEALLLARDRGAIATVATTRLVYAQPNAILNQQYFRFLFENGKPISARLGMAMMWARLQTYDTENDEKFHVLGDPSLRLAIPRYQAEITSLQPDTVKALTVMRVQGKIKRADGADWPDYNGIVRLEALDAQREVRYQSSGNFSIDYALPGNSLFRGEAPIKNGAFTAQFFVPKDITYGGTTGRLNLYFWNDQTDGNGYRAGLPVGGTATSLADKTGPAINIGFVNADDFRSGGVVGTNPILRALISDTLSGVNITGEIGHKIMLTLDGRVEDKIDVTDLFNYDSGSYTRGTVIYPLGKELSKSEGRHTVEIKAWDNLNNSSTVAVDFVVQPQDRLILSEVMNYPNPFRRRTTFTFTSNLAAEVRVKIFSLSGRLIRALEYFNARPGFNMLEWDGLDEDGDELGNGVYLYKVIAIQRQNAEILNAEEIGKVVVQR